MKKQTADFATVTEKGVVTRIGQSTVIQPKPGCNKDSVKWFNDDKLLKDNRN